MRITSKLPINILSLMGEYAVASELCRRNIYAQLTLGNKKRTDLLAMTESGFIRIEVKTKQGKTWPHCKGIGPDKDAFLIFVDYANKEQNTRPDFFILDCKDWKNVAERRIREIKKKRPYKKIKLTEENVIIALSQKDKSKKTFLGTDISSAIISNYKEKWIKIEKKLKANKI